MGMKNLQRVAKMIMPATAWKEGETYEDLSEIYGRMLSQWQLEMNHVAQVVGGLNSQEKVVGPGRPRLYPGSQIEAGRSRKVPGGKRARDAACG